MMTPEAHIDTPVRVSILERVVPSLGFAVAALSGVVGAMMIFRFFRLMRSAETAGYAAFFGGMAEIEFVVGVVLIVALVLCAIGVLVSIIRLFTTNTTSSPPGILLLLVGLLSVLPPFAIHYALHWMKGVVASPSETPGGISSIANSVTYISYFAIGFAVVIVFVLLAFSFVPFSSRAGRKVLPLVALMLVEILIAVLVGVYFWEARNSIAERDKDRAPIASDSPDFDESSVEFPEGLDANRALDDIATNGLDPADTDTDSRSNTKTISGGVLNGKAIDFPQPSYPPAARAVRASGQVSVQVTVDVKGEVVAASAVSGHPLLRMAAVQAARKAKFKPTLLSGQPVKVTGVITYNFSLQ